MFIIILYHYQDVGEAATDHWWEEKRNVSEVPIQPKSIQKIQQKSSQKVQPKSIQKIQPKSIQKVQLISIQIIQLISKQYLSKNICSVYPWFSTHHLYSTYAEGSDASKLRLSDSASVLRPCSNPR